MHTAWVHAVPEAVAERAIETGLGMDADTSDVQAALDAACERHHMRRSIFGLRTEECTDLGIDMRAIADRERARLREEWIAGAEAAE